MQERFSYQESKNGLVQISFEGKVVTRLRGKEAVRFLDRVSRADPKTQQLVMAKATGHFKHGNERRLAPG